MERIYVSKEYQNIEYNALQKVIWKMSDRISIHNMSVYKANGMKISLFDSYNTWINFRPEKIFRVLNAYYADGNLRIIGDEELINFFDNCVVKYVCDASKLKQNKEIIAYG